MPDLADYVAAAATLTGRRRLAEAEALLGEARDQFGDSVVLLNAIAALAIAGGDLAGGTEILSRIAPAAPDDPAVLSNLALAHRLAGRTDEAAACLDRAIDRDPRSVATRLARAEILLEKGEHDRAAALARQALDLDPHSGAARMTAGLIAVEAGRSEEAVLHFEAAAVLSPENADPFLNLAALHAGLARPDLALDAAERAFLRAPDDAVVLKTCADLLLQAGEWARARRLADRVLALSPRDLAALQSSATARVHGGDADRALADLAGAVRGRSREPDALLVLARVLRTAGRTGQALAVVDDLLTFAPGTPGAQALRADCLLTLGRLDEVWRTGDDDPAGPVDAVLVPPAFPISELVLVARFLPRLAAAGQTLDVIAGASHGSVLADLPGLNPIEAVAADGRRVLPVALAPFRLRLGRADLPGSMPYLMPDAARLAAWRHALDALPGRRIGLVWRGPRDGPGLGDLLACLDPDDTAISLMVGDRRRDLLDHPTVLDAGHHIEEPRDLVAAVAVLDALIVSDCLAAHLAGALARPALVFVTPGHAWVWAAENGRAIWYPDVTVATWRGTGRHAPAIGEFLGSLAGRSGKANGEITA